MTHDTELISLAIQTWHNNRAKQQRLEDQRLKGSASIKTVKRVRDRTISYNHMHRGTWHRPEYDFDQIQIAQDTDSFMTRSIMKKVNKLMCAGWDIVGLNPEPVAYIKRRLLEQEVATNKPWDILMSQISADMFRFDNCMLVKARNDKASSGNMRTDIDGTKLQPVAGYFILPFETLEYRTKSNGEFKKIMQRMPGGDKKEFLPKDVVHFYSNRKPGFAVGTPQLWPALDDIALLRRIEENVEELIETNLFPVYHYKVGSDTMPERVGVDGFKETDQVKRTVEYMPASGIYVSDHRHEITAIGSEGRALRIDFYLTYFRNRVFAALGTSALDMGEGAGANRSTASTLSKGMLMDVEAVACLIKAFFDFYIINELLLEGGYDPLHEDDRVEIEFGVIDKEEKRAQENHLIQAFHGNVRDLDEIRQMLGDRPWRDEQMDRTHYKMFEEPLALVKSMSPGSAAGDILAGLPGSNVTSEAVAKERKFAEKASEANAAGGQSGARPSGSGTGARSASAARNRPSNQHGTRSTAKTTRDLTSGPTNITIYAKDSTLSHTLDIDGDISAEHFAEWHDLVMERYDMLADANVSFDTVVENLIWRLKSNN